MIDVEKEYELPSNTGSEPQMRLFLSSHILRSSRIAPDGVNTPLEFTPVRWLTGVTIFHHNPLPFGL